MLLRQLPGRAGLNIVVGVFLCVVAWGLLPGSPRRASWAYAVVLNCAVMTGAVLSYGRVRGIVAWAVGVSTALAGSKMAHSLGQVAGDIAMCISLGVIIATAAAYSIYCAVRRRRQTVVVMVLVVVAWVGVFVGPHLDQTLLWSYICGVPPSVVALWFVGLVGGGVLGSTFRLIEAAEYDLGH